VYFEDVNEKEIHGDKMPAHSVRSERGELTRLGVRRRMKEMRGTLDEL
jgi:hypothetical protein